MNKVLISLLFLISINFFDYRYAFWGQTLSYFAIFLLLLFTFTGRKSKIKKTFLPYVIAIYVILPLCSSVTCLLYHGQPLTLSLMANVRILWPILIYFYLHSKNVNPKVLIQIIIVFAVIWTFIELIQQFTFPSYIFAIREHDNPNGIPLENRNGIWRYMIQPWFLGTFLVIYSWINILDKRNSKKWVLLFIIGVLGVVLYITRVVILSVFICCVLIYLNNSNYSFQKKVRILFVIAFLLCPFLLNFDAIFGDMIELTQQQVDAGDNYIRMQAITFYLEYTPNLYCALFGNGYPHSGSAYGKEIYGIEETSGLYRADIGLIGEYSIYGFLYIVCFVVFFYKVWKEREKLEKYQRYCFLALLLGSYIMPPFRDSLLFILGMLLYMSDWSCANKERTVRMKSHIKENVGNI